MAAVPVRPAVLICDWGSVEPPERLLGAGEREYASRLAGERRREWVRSRLTACAALCWVTGGRPRDVLPDASGRPVVRGARVPGTFVSLAHSGSVSVCAVGGLLTGAVGVDVEPVDSRNNVLLRRIATDDDLAAVQGLPPAVRSTVLVCAKESAYKAYRCGPQNLRVYSVRSDRNGRMCVGLADHKRRGLNLWLSDFGGYVVAVCARTRAMPRLQVVGAGPDPCRHGNSPRSASERMPIQLDNAYEAPARSRRWGLRAWMMPGAAPPHAMPEEEDPRRTDPTYARSV